MFYLKNFLIEKKVVVGKVKHVKKHTPMNYQLILQIYESAVN
jgi:hypothetical protein